MRSRQPSGCHLRSSTQTASQQCRVRETATGLAACSHSSALTQYPYPLGVPPSPPLTPEAALHSCKTPSELEHVEPGFGLESTNDAAKKRRSRIMPSSPDASPPPPTRCPAFSFPTILSADADFTFRLLSRPEQALSFRPRTPSPKPSKRRRPAADVDGEHSSPHKKKRRLRLFLITSRLSPQFSHPATNIVDRGNSKIAVWAKQRASGRHLLRKAAILNRIRRQSISALETAGGLGRVLVEQEKEQEQLQLARLTFIYGSHEASPRTASKDVVELPDVVETRTGEQIRAGGSPPSSPPLRACDEESAAGEYRSPNDAYYTPLTPKSPRPSHLPLPPSPLGLSNYDALDLEDDLPDPYAHLDEEYDAHEQAEDSDSFDYAFPSCPAFPRKQHEAPKVSSLSSSSDLTVLEPEEPVMGDYDQVEEGAEPVWPGSPHLQCREVSVEKSSTSLPEFQILPSHMSAEGWSSFALSLSAASASPNFRALCATSPAGD